MKRFLNYTMGILLIILSLVVVSYPSNSKENIDKENMSQLVGVAHTNFNFLDMINEYDDDANTIVRKHLIKNEQNMYDVAASIDKNLLSTKNIHFKVDTSVKSNFELGSYYLPIGNFSKSDSQFQGTFDGDGANFNLNFTRATFSRRGQIAIFGWNGSSGIIKNLSTSGYVEGANDFADGVSSVAARNEGLVKNVYSTTKVVAGSTTAQTAGIVANNNNKGVIKYAYNVGEIIGQSNTTGAIVAHSNGVNSVDNTYSRSKISNNYGKGIIGGITGFEQDVTTNSNNFYDIDVIDQAKIDEPNYSYPLGALGSFIDETNKGVNSRLLTSDNISRFFEDEKWTYLLDQGTFNFYPQLRFFATHANPEIRDRSLESVKVELNFRDNIDLDGISINEDNIITNIYDQYKYTIKDSKNSYITIDAIFNDPVEGRTFELIDKDTNQQIIDNKILINYLKPGDNNFIVRVIAENSSFQDYDLLIYKKSSDASILDLDLSVDNTYLLSNNNITDGITKKFESTKLNYEFNLDSSHLGKILTVNNIIGSDNSKLTLPPNLSTPLNKGTNTFEFVNTAEDGVTLIKYIITIEIISDDTSLNDIVLDNTSIGLNFDTNNTMTYTLANNIGNSILLNILTNDALATVNINSKGNNTSFNIEEGNNTFTIVVTAADSTTTKTYTLILIKLSTDNSLKLEVDGVDITFDNNNEIKLSDILFNKLTFNVKHDIHDNANITFNAINSTYSNDLWTVNSGTNTLEITVTAENLSVVTYKVIVQKEQANDNLLDLYIETEDRVLLPFEIVYQDGLYSYDLILGNNTSYVNLKLVVMLDTNQTTDLLSDIINLQYDQSNEINQNVSFKLSYYNVEVQNYSINITKGKVLSNNNELISLTLTNLNNEVIDLHRTNNNFTLVNPLAFTVNTVNLMINTHVSAKLVDVNVALLTNNVNNIINLIVGTNKIEFRIESEAGNKGVLYTIELEREAAANDATFKSLELQLDDRLLISNIDLSDSRTIEFNSTTFIYRFILDSNKFNRSVIGKRLTWNAFVADGATFTNGVNYTITNAGIHKFEFIVTAQSGATNKYEIEILIENSEVLVDKIELDGVAIPNLVTDTIIQLNDITDKTSIYEMESFVNSNIIYSEYTEKRYVNNVEVFTMDLISYLEYKTNDITIILIPEDGNQNNTLTYNFEVTRIDTRDSDNSLIGFELEDDLGNSINITKINDLEYSADVIYSISNLSLLIKIANTATLIDVTGLNIIGNVKFSFTINNTIVLKFKIEAENESISSEYTLTINKLAPSNENNLVDLEVLADDLVLISSDASLNPIFAFSNAQIKYTFDGINKLNQSYTVNPLDFTKLVVSDFATVSINNKMLVKGPQYNQIIITVTAENGDNKDYILEILVQNSEYKVEDIEVNNIPIVLDDALSLDGYILPDVDLNNNSLTINVILSKLLEHLDANVVISNYTNLPVGVHTITIDVTAEDGSNLASYKLIQEVLKVPSNDNSLNYITIDGIRYEANQFNNNVLDIVLEFEKQNEVELIVFPLDIQNASYKIDNLNTNNKVDIIYGINTITFTIIAENKDTNSFTINIDAKSNGNDITDISVDNYTLDKPFNQADKDYYLTVKGNVTSIDLNVKASKYATITGMGNIQLALGTQIIEVYATNEFGTIGTKYYVHITKQSNETKVDDILINGDTPEYIWTSENEATIKVPFEDGDSINIDFIVGSDRTVLGNKTVALVHGDSNKLIIEVVAEDGTKKEYTITINALYDDNTITNLQLDNGELNFVESTLVYEINVNYTTDKLNLTVSKHDFATTTITKQTKMRQSANLDLSIGLNSFVIYVTSEFGTKGTSYTLNVNKAAKPLSNDASVINISVSGYDLSPKFSNDIKEYSFNVNSNVKKLDINVTKGHEGQTVVISETANNLVSGTNTITITVTSEDGAVVNTFTLTVEKAENSKGIVILIVTLSTLAVIGISAFIILFVAKKRNTPGQVELSVKENDNNNEE